METENKNAAKYALITGATSGLGYEFARLFARDGYGLILVARSVEALNKTCEEMIETYRINCRPVAQDLFNPGAAERIYAQTKTWGIRIDALVNNAGQGEYGKFIEYDMARDVDLIQLNITTLANLTKLFLKDMIARNEGRILQVSSMLSRYPTPLMAVYAGTKSFVLSFTEALINEVKDTKVSVSVLLPESVDSDFFHKAGAENTVTYRRSELTSPEEVAGNAYEAFMKGKSIIMSGAGNKVKGFISNIMPDSARASIMRRLMSPSEKDHRRTEILHPPSRKERNRIEKSTGSVKGDYSGHQGHVHSLVPKTIKRKK